MSFAENFNRLMKERGLTRYRVSKELNTATQTVCNWASGRSIPDTQSALKLAAYFNTTVEQLMK